MLPARPPIDFTLDVNASLFLNLYGVAEEELLSRGGRCVYARTGTAPCVMHANGRAAKPKMRKVMQCAPPTAWVVPRGDPWEDIHKA